MIRMNCNIGGFNKNKCAWGKLGKNQPKEAADCLGDQTNPVADCCYMEMLFTGGGKFAICDILPKTTTMSETDEQLKISAQKQVGPTIKVLSYICKGEKKVEADKENTATSNSCGYDNIKFIEPNKKSDCNDPDPDKYDKCCYLNTKWGGKDVRQCSALTMNTTNTEMKDLYKVMGGELIAIDCDTTAGNYFKISISAIMILSLYFL